MDSLYYREQRGFKTSRLFKQSSYRNVAHVSLALSCSGFCQSCWTVTGEVVSELPCGSAKSLSLNLILLLNTRPSWWKLLSVQLGSGCNIQTHCVHTCRQKHSNTKTMCSEFSMLTAMKQWLVLEVQWPSTGGRVEGHWRSSGGPLEVQWRSSGRPVEVQWCSLAPTLSSSV